MLRSLALLTALFLVGCADDTAEAPEAASPEAVSPEASGAATASEAVPDGGHSAMVLDGPTTYICSGGEQFTLSPSPDGATADVELPDRKAALERMDASAGLRYGADGLVVWVADDGAFVVENEEAILEDCAAATDA